jgi:hypothetical protein
MHERPGPLSNGVAKILILAGCAELVVAAGIHWFAAYPRLSSALATSNLSGYLQAALRAVFVLVAWQWIAMAVIALLATFGRTKAFRALIAFCSIALFVETAITLKFIGVFLGNELLGSAAALLLLGSWLSGSEN